MQALQCWAKPKNRGLWNIQKVTTVLTICGLLFSSSSSSVPNVINLCAKEHCVSMSHQHVRNTVPVLPTFGRHRSSSYVLHWLHLANNRTCFLFMKYSCDFFCHVRLLSSAAFLCGTNKAHCACWSGKLASNALLLLVASNTATKNMLFKDNSTFNVTRATLKQHGFLHYIQDRNCTGTFSSRIERSKIGGQRIRDQNTRWKRQAPLGCKFVQAQFSTRHTHNQLINARKERKCCLLYVHTYLCTSAGSMKQWSFCSRWLPCDNLNHDQTKFPCNLSGRNFHANQSSSFIKRTNELLVALEQFWADSNSFLSVFLRTSSPPHWKGTTSSPHWGSGEGMTQTRFQRVRVWLPQSGGGREPNSQQGPVLGEICRTSREVLVETNRLTVPALITPWQKRSGMKIWQFVCTEGTTRR